jgi:hypothetical protein
VSARPLTDLVEAGWAAALEPVGEQVARVGAFLRAEIAACRGYLPPGPDVLRAFTFPMAQVRVLIVGQDPYPTPGHAVGLSFSVAPGVRPLPRSLTNIFTEYTADLGYPAPASGDLTEWAQRGVLLLNRVLTVRAGAPASHRGQGWEEVTADGMGKNGYRAVLDKPKGIKNGTSDGNYLDHYNSLNCQANLKFALKLKVDKRATFMTAIQHDGQHMYSQYSRMLK